MQRRQKSIRQETGGRRGLQKCPVRNPAILRPHEEEGTVECFESHWTLTTHAWFRYETKELEDCQT